MIQASLYVVAFMWTCIWAYLYGFLVTLGVDVPYTIILLFSIFYPFGGFLNILVYTRPKINALRKRDEHLTWTQAFIAVVKAGGEEPESLPPARRTSSGNSPRNDTLNQTPATRTLNENDDAHGGSRRSNKSSEGSNGDNHKSKEDEAQPTTTCRGSFLLFVDENISEESEEEFLEELGDEEECKEEIKSTMKEWRFIPKEVGFLVEIEVHNGIGQQPALEDDEKCVTEEFIPQIALRVVVNG